MTVVTGSGAPGDLAAWTNPNGPHAWPGLWKPTADVVPGPTGFCESVFRVVRDPAVVTDDSGSTLGTQVYNHGWLLAVWLSSYASLKVLPVTWPADGGFKVLPVTGTPVVADGVGTHGMQSVTWPGSGVGVGTLRQVVSGDGGSTRQVGAILDLLAATTSAQKTTIGSTYTSTVATIDPARVNLFLATQALSAAAKSQVLGRSELAAFLGCQAVAAPRGSTLENGIMWAMYAIVAKEAGLIGATFTTANYETLTQPIDAVLAMPSGY